MPPIEAYPLIALIGTISCAGTMFSITKAYEAFMSKNRHFDFEDDKLLKYETSILRRISNSLPDIKP